MASTRSLSFLAALSAVAAAGVRTSYTLTDTSDRAIRPRLNIGATGSNGTPYTPWSGTSVGTHVNKQRRPHRHKRTR